MMERRFKQTSRDIFKKIKSWKMFSGLVIGMTVCSSYSLAQGNTTQLFNIQPNTMSEALTLFAMQTDSQILFSPRVVENKKSMGLKGEYTQQQALEKLLAGTNLAITKNGEKVFMIVSSEQEEEINAKIYMGDSEKKRYRNAVIEEVRVTANKREQNLQDVAASLSALTGDDLNRIGAVGAEDYLAQIPGVNYNALGRGRSPVIVRGISTISTTILGDSQSTSAIYIDDLPSLQRWGAWTSTDPNTFDVERVEVLRGPQGTLFGSGALGGALRVINKKPSASEFQSSVDIGQSFTQGGDDSSSLNAMLNVPLIQDELSLRVVGFTRNDGGYVDNVRRNEKNVNSGEMKGGRMMLAYQPNESLSLRFTATHQADIVDDNSATFRDAADGRSYEYNGVDSEFSDVSINIYNIAIDYDFGESLFTSSTTYSKRDSFLNLDLVSLVDAIFETGLDPDENNYSSTEDVETYAQEFRLVSQDNPDFQWTIGAFFLDQKITTLQDWTADNLDGDNVVTESIFLPHIREQAIFGEMTYQLTDQLSLTAGGRWFDNTFELEIPVNQGAFSNPPLPLTKDTSSSFTPKFSASYFLSDDVHFYLSATKGFRIGQINIVVAPDEGVPLSYDPDSLWNYELGMKSFLLDGRLRLNMAAYYIDWTDIQLQRQKELLNGIIANFNDNVGDAISKGVEVEATYLIDRNWELGTALSYTDAALESVAEVEGVDDRGIVAGATLPGTPDFSMTNYIQYTPAVLPNDLTAYLRLSHQHVGQMVTNIVNQDHLYSDTYNTFNLRAGLFYQNYEAALYVNNLTDNDAATSKYDIDIFNMNTFRAYRLKPRTMGLTFRVDF